MRTFLLCLDDEIVFEFKASPTDAESILCAYLIASDWEKNYELEEGI